MKLDNIEPETLLDMAIERLRDYHSFFIRVSEDLWPRVQDLEEFLEKYDEWKKEREDEQVCPGA